MPLLIAGMIAGSADLCARDFFVDGRHRDASDENPGTAQRPAVWLYGRHNRLEHCVVKEMAGGGWSTAGIQIAESMDCVIAFNTSVKNKDGIAFREQGPRFIDDRPYYNRGIIVVGNVRAFNQGHQPGFWCDDAFFG